MVEQKTIEEIVTAASEFLGSDHFYTVDHLTRLLDKSPRSLSLTHSKSGEISGYSLVFPLTVETVEGLESGSLSSGLEITPEHLDESSPSAFYVAMVQGFHPSAKASVLLDMSEVLLQWMKDTGLEKTLLFARQGHPSSRAIMSTSGFTPISSTSIGHAVSTVAKLSSFVESRRLMADILAKRS